MRRMSALQDLATSIVSDATRHGYLDRDPAWMARQYAALLPAKRRDELAALIGRMIADRFPLIPLATCTYCGGQAVIGSTCPKSIECPACHAPAGSACKRPSGHACDVHRPRSLAAEQLDVDNGVIYP